MLRTPLSVGIPALQAVTPALHAAGMRISLSNFKEKTQRRGR